MIKDNKMNHINIDKIELIQQNKDVVLNVYLCNKNTETYYLEKRRLPYHYSDTTDYYISQDNEYIKSYIRSPKRKLRPSKFPDDYVAIEPKDCLTLKTKLNDFFHFNTNKPLTVYCNAHNVCPNVRPDANSLDLIKFKKTFTLITNQI